MTTDCTVYVSSVANPRKHPRKISCLENFESYRNLDCSISLKEPTSPLIKDSKLDLVKQIEEL